MSGPQTPNRVPSRHRIRSGGITSEFIGWHLGHWYNKKEHPNWHYYLTTKGTVYHFRKEHIAWVQEVPLSTRELLRQDATLVLEKDNPWDVGKLHRRPLLECEQKMLMDRPEELKNMKEYYLV